MKCIEKSAQKYVNALAMQRDNIKAIAMIDHAINQKAWLNLKHGITAVANFDDELTDDGWMEVEEFITICDNDLKRFSELLK